MNKLKVGDVVICVSSDHSWGDQFEVGVEYIVNTVDSCDPDDYDIRVDGWWVNSSDFKLNEKDVNKFKVGDKVRRVKEKCVGMRLGSVWTIQKVSSTGNIVLEESNNGYWDCDNSELVESNAMPEFEAGMVVEVEWKSCDGRKELRMYVNDNMLLGKDGGHMALKNVTVEVIYGVSDSNLMSIDYFADKATPIWRKGTEKDKSIRTIEEKMAEMQKELDKLKK